MEEEDPPKRRSLEFSCFFVICFPLQLVYGWFWPYVVQFCRKSPSLSDLPRLSRWDELESGWLLGRKESGGDVADADAEGETPPLLQVVRKRILRVTWLPFLVSGICRLVTSASWCTMPYFLARLLGALAPLVTDESRTLYEHYRQILPTELRPNLATAFRTGNWETWVWLLAFTLGYGFGLLFQELSFHIGMKAGIRAKAVLMDAVYSRLLQLKAASPPTFSGGAILNLIASDVDKVQLGFMYFHGVWGVVPIMIVSIVYLVQILKWSLLISFASLVICMPIIVVGIIVESHFQNKRSGRTDERISKTSELISDVRTLKYFGWERHYLEKIFSIRDAELCNYIAGMGCNGMVEFGIYSSVKLTEMLAFVSLAGFQGWLEPLHVFPAAFAYGLIGIGMDVMPNALGSLIGMRISWKRLDAFLSSESEDPDVPLVAPRDGDSFVIENGSFTWSDPEEPFLQNVSIAIPKGKTGSGKTTLLHALLGELRVVEATTYQRTARIAYCAQQAWLQPGTVRENVVFGNPVSERLLSVLSRICCIEEDLDSLSDGWETEITPGGSNLSGGQRARIALARTCYRRDMVDAVLLDDVLGAVDPHIAQAIMTECICHFLSPVTRVLVTHQLHFLDQADYIIVVDDGMFTPSLSDLTNVGKIAESGSFEELWYPAGTLQSLAMHNVIDALQKKGVATEETEQFLSSTTTIPVSSEAALAFLRSPSVASVLASARAALPSADPSPDLLSSAAGFLSPQVDAADFDADSWQSVHCLLSASAFLSALPRRERPYVARLDSPSAAIPPPTAVDPLSLARAAQTTPTTVSCTSFETFYCPRNDTFLVVWLIVGLVCFARFALVLVSWWLSEWSSGSYSVQYGKSYLANFSFNEANNSHFTSLSDYNGTCSFPSPYVCASELLELSWITTFSDGQILKDGLSVGWSAGIFVILTVVALIGIFFMYVCGFMLCITFSKFLHDRALRSVFSAPVSFFHKTSFGEIASRFSTELENVDSKVVGVGIAVLSRITWSMESGILLLYVTRGLSAPVLVLVFLVLGLLYALYRRSAIALKSIDATSREPTVGLISDTLSGLSTIRAFGQEPNFVKNFRGHVDAHNRASSFLWSSKRWIHGSLALLALPLLFSVGAILISGYLYGPTGDWWVSPKGNIGMGILTAAVFGIFVLPGLPVIVDYELELSAVERLSEYSNDLKSEVELSRIRGGKRMYSENDRAMQRWPVSGSISFRNVTLRYDEGLPLVLKGVSFEARDGERVGLVGRSGCGKSTCYQALFRLAEIEEGQIFIDGIDISRIPLHVLRRHIVIVPQEPVLFSGTIRSNLDPFEDHSDAELWDALRDSFCDDLVRKMDGQLDAPVAGGTSFSVGQKQLLCLARAVLRKPKILLLDEVTANVDKRTDNLIQNMIQRCFHCTRLTIAHRLTTLLDSDRILVLDDGTVAENDSLCNLVWNPETYNQFNEFIDESGEGEAIRARFPFPEEEEEEGEEAAVFLLQEVAEIEIGGQVSEYVVERIANVIDEDGQVVEKTVVEDFVQLLDQEGVDADLVNIVVDD